MKVQAYLTWNEKTKSYIVKGFNLDVSVVEILNITEGLSMVAESKRKDKNRAKIMLEEIHKEMEMHKEMMEKDFSHSPEKNTYSDDWRKLP